MSMDVQGIYAGQAEHSEAAHAGHRHAGAAPAASRWTRARRFGWHYVQMVVVMALGMPLYGMFRGLLTQAGYGSLLRGNQLLSFALMALFMSIPMVLLMRRHGHGWQHSAEMVAAMALPGLALIALVQAGLSAGTWLTVRSVFGLAHGVMLIGMLGQMVVRREMYG